MMAERQSQSTALGRTLRKIGNDGAGSLTEVRRRLPITIEIADENSDSETDGEQLPFDHLPTLLGR